MACNTDYVSGSVATLLYTSTSLSPSPSPSPTPALPCPLLWTATSRQAAGHPDDATPTPFFSPPPSPDTLFLRHASVPTARHTFGAVIGRLLCHVSFRSHRKRAPLGIKCWPCWLESRCAAEIEPRPSTMQQYSTFILSPPNHLPWPCAMKQALKRAGSADEHRCSPSDLSPCFKPPLTYT